MRKLLLLGALLVLVAPILRAQAPVLGPDEAIGFDYADADVTVFEVNRFEAQYDSGAWTPIGMVVSSTTAGITTYKTTPTQTNGTHSVVIRACNVLGCGGASSPFAFAVLTAPTSAPVNLRKVPR